MHKQVAMAFLGCVMLGLGCCARALAITEYCPAQVGRLHPLDGRGSASLYAFALNAESTRSVRGTVMVSTSAGWFAVKVPPTALTQRTYNYASDYAQFSLLAYESTPLYVRFPQAVTITDDYVANVISSGDQVFGWDAKGDVTCTGRSGGNPAKWASKDVNLLNPRTDLEAMPDATATVIQAVAASAPGPQTCTQPSSSGTVFRAVAPDYPAGWGPSVKTIVVVKVAVSSSGKIDDAWIYFPSGSKTLDAAAVRAERASTYKPGLWLCQPADGYYYFNAEFNP